MFFEDSVRLFDHGSGAFQARSIGQNSYRDEVTLILIRDETARHCLEQAPNENDNAHEQ